MAATGRALVPGCGSGYVAARPAAASYDVLAVGFSPAAVNRARRLSARQGATILKADFFLLQESDFDCICERAFMCALPPFSRLRWAQRCAELLRPRGVMIGLFFLDPEATDGPPFGIGESELESLLAPAFTKCDDRPSVGSQAGRGRLYWAFCPGGLPMRPFLLILVLLLTGCGQRGPLYLPDQDPGDAVNEPTTSAEAAAVETGPAEPVSPDSREDEQDREGKRTDEDVHADR